MSTLDFYRYSQIDKTKKQKNKIKTKEKQTRKSLQETQLGIL